MTIQTFIFIHDQDILLDYLRVNKFKNLKDLKFVYLGNGDVSKIEKLENVIISRNLTHNIEQYPKFTSFTGWYSLWKNNLINSDYVNLFEYDVNIVSNFSEIQEESILRQSPEFIGYIPYPVNSYDYIQNINWVKDIIPAIKEIYSIDIYEVIKNLLSQNLNSMWSSTSNSTFKTKIFFEYMKWFEPIIDFLKNSNTCGHSHERSISFFYFTQNKKVKLIPRIMSHLQLDSHKTQGHFVDMDSSIKKLLEN